MCFYVRATLLLIAQKINMKGGMSLKTGEISFKNESEIEFYKQNIKEFLARRLAVLKILKAEGK